MIDQWMLTESILSAVSTGGGERVPAHVRWPLRNSKVFHSLNAVMERCNDLVELVHTIHDFRYCTGTVYDWW